MKKKSYPALPLFMLGEAWTSISNVFKKDDFMQTNVPGHIGTEYNVITDLEDFVKKKKVAEGDKVEFVNHNDIKLMRFKGLKRGNLKFADENPMHLNEEYSLKDLQKLGFTPRAVIKPILNSH